MTNEKFEESVKHQITKCLTLLNVKNEEYTGERLDRFHTFEIAAELQGCNKKQALAGMMAKHSVSVYDMCQGGEYSYDKWLEKITDSINYLLILRAMIDEEVEGNVAV